MVALVDKIIKNIIIFGKNGQVGSNLINLFENDYPHFNISSYNSKLVNFNSLSAVKDFLDNLNIIPDLIINAAAYTAVDKAEEEKQIAENINFKAVQIIADFCARKQVKLIHYSTDYVFNGAGNEAFEEDNISCLQPLNFYGKTKFEGEKAIISSGCNYIIFRTSWVYSEKGRNFVNTMIRLLQEKEELSIVSDQIGSPTYAKDIASYTITMINKKFISGIYHLTNSGYCSWYDFTKAIANILKSKNIKLKTEKIIPVKTADYRTLAQRPLNSRLNIDKVTKALGIKPRSWRQALEDMINNQKITQK